MSILDAVQWCATAMRDIPAIKTAPEFPGGGPFPIAITHIGSGSVSVGNPAQTWYSLNTIVIEIHVSGEAGNMGPAIQALDNMHDLVIAALADDVTLGGYVQTYGLITFTVPMPSSWNGSATWLRAYTLNDVKIIGGL